MVAETAENHKALNLRILNVSTHCDYADFFVLMSATSTRHAKSLADSIVEAVRLPASRIEGHANGEWVLLDLGDIVVHVFHEPVRAYYSLDKLWAHAPSVQPAALAPARRRVAAKRVRR